MTAPTIDEQIAHQRHIAAMAGARPDSERQKVNIKSAILATLQSIKDAGDDVVEPDCVTINREIAHPLSHTGLTIAYADALKSAYKRVCVERDGWINVATADMERAEKAESEREQFRKDAERYRYFKQHLCEPHAIAHFVKFNNWHPSDAEYLRDLDAAIDSARNK